MKKTLASLVLATLVFCLANTAYAFDWVYYGDVDGDMNSTMRVGKSHWDAAENDETQSPGISGAGTLLPAGYSNVKVDFTFNQYTWDSYNPEFTTSIPDPDEPGGFAIDGGYLDVFGVALSDQNYYWNLSNNDNDAAHPLENNPYLVSPNNNNGYWGGQSYFDHALETNLNAPLSFTFTTDPSKQYYLTFFLQTREDESYPSWGSVSNVQVTPEPISSVLFLLGGGVLGTRLLRKKKAV